MLVRAAAGQGSDGCGAARESRSWRYLGTAGRAGPVASVINAMHAIETGQANVVWPRRRQLRRHRPLPPDGLFQPGLPNYGTPNGFGGANGLFGIIQRKHMETYGTRREDLGRISVDQRRNSARRNEMALLRGSLTIEDYLNARVIADPIRLYDCVLPCAGAEAVVVTTLDRAPPGRGVRILSGFERHNHPPMEIAPLRGGWELYRDRLCGKAGTARMRWISSRPTTTSDHGGDPNRGSRLLPEG